MKVLLFTAYFPPDTGSASHLFAELGAGLVSRGHEVRVLTGFPHYFPTADTARFRGRMRVTETVDGMVVVRTATPRLPRHVPMLRAVWQFAEASTMLAAVFMRAADVAIVYSPPLPVGLAACGARALRGIPFILNVQDLFPQSVIDLGLLKSPRAIRSAEAMERFVYRWAAQITVHSEGNRDHVVGKGAAADAVSVVPNWIDVTGLAPGPRMNSLRAELGLGPEKFIVSFAGVMGYSQDLDTIVEVARRLRDQKEIVFLLVGDGIERPRLEERSRALGLGNVRFLPMQAKERYPLVLHASDVCLATLHATVKTPVVPSKILSILAAARPVVAALDAAGDAVALVKASGGGVCVPPEDPVALEAAVLRLQAEPALGRTLGEQGRRYAESHLSISSALDAYESIMSRVVGRAAAAHEVCR